MKILHTADWHLGQKFIFRERTEEHQLFLEWLLGIIQDEKVDALIVSGDIFDVGNPPHYARSLYYQFLSGLIKSACRYILITGGNHDSPSMLNAPKDLLRALNIQVVGSVSELPENDVMEWRDQKGKLEAVIAAIPFLRDRDIKFISAFESGDARLNQIKKGIIDHFEVMAALVEPYKQLDIPVITTGHLYAKGATASDTQQNIYLGNMDNIDPADIPDIFDYVALGHLHKAQPMGKLRHIRYSGSPIPLSFPETKDKKSVTIVSFQGKKINEIQIKEIPVFRILKIIEGDLNKVFRDIEDIHQQIVTSHHPLTAWVEVIIRSDKHEPGIDNELRDFVADKKVEILKYKTILNHQAVQNNHATVLLTELTPEMVFRKRCEAYPEQEIGHLALSFQELLDWMHENEVS